MPKALQKHLEVHEKEKTEGLENWTNATSKIKKKRRKGKHYSVSNNYDEYCYLVWHMVSYFGNFTVGIPHSIRLTDMKLNHNIVLFCIV